MITNALGFELEVYGLKPNTLHRIYLDWIDITETTILRGVNTDDQSTTWISDYTPGGLLPSDGLGQLSLIAFKVDQAPDSTLKAENADLSNMKGSATILICSSDISAMDILNTNSSYKNARSFSLSVIDSKNIETLSINTEIQIPFSSSALQVSN